MVFNKNELGPALRLSDGELAAIVDGYENHPYKLFEGEHAFHGAILVTHHTIIPPLAAFIGIKNQFSAPVNMGEIQTGQAVYLDLENRTHRILP